MAKMIINGEVYSGSTNYASAITYIKEDGTKSTVQKELDSRPVNNNILINSNFANPVNQRGVTAETWNHDTYALYGLDRWINSHCTVSSITNGLTVTGKDGIDSDISQRIEPTEIEDGKKYTFSACIDGKIVSGTGVVNKTDIIRAYEDESFSLLFGYVPTTSCYIFTIRFNDLNPHTIKWAKLELGEVATLYVSRLYEEELELCQRYYQIIHNNLFPWSATTSDMVFHQHFKPMRITPTISIIEAAVYLDNQKQSGFKFRTDYKTNRRFNLYATKSSHGLKSKAYVGLFLNVTLDAEL